jgi:hypothetical protein
MMVVRRSHDFIDSSQEADTNDTIDSIREPKEGNLEYPEDSQHSLFPFSTGYSYFFFY